jgi:hypothetical protein
MLHTGESNSFRTDTSIFQHILNPSAHYSSVSAFLRHISLNTAFTFLRLDLIPTPSRTSIGRSYIVGFPLLRLWRKKIPKLRLETDVTT